MTAERRKFLRMAMRLNVTYKIIGTAKTGKSLTHDLGGGGVRFLAEHPLNVGNLLEMTLRLPEGDRVIKFVGEVVWNKSATAAEKGTGTGGSREVGVRFTQIDPKDQQALRHYEMFYLPPQSG